MEHAELLDRVRELRAEGKSPKQIARALGLSPAAVTPLVRAVAAAVAAERAGALGALLGSWTNLGWSAGLSYDPASGWTDRLPEQAETGGMVSVLVARRHGYDRVVACGYLADVWCLGVKNVTGPKATDEREFSRFREYFFGEYAGWQAVPLDLARQIVLGSIEYASGFGFAPHRDFTAETAAHLGEWDVPSAITFGREGKPFYVEGPDDEAHRIRRVLAEYGHA